ncbi:MAG: branched-chain amino acid ABC transporter permease [Acidimicrobiia bacterium]|nr:branched-chain amino acid ABC transporter permease [Acidimicrobiia bacterium]
MGKVVQVVVFTSTIGSIYALVALGYSLIFSTTRIVNFAQGTLVVVGGYLAWWLYSEVLDENVPLPLVTVAVVILSGLVGLAFDLVAVAPLGRFDPSTSIAWLVTTFGAGIVAQEIVAKTISDSGQTVPDLVSSVFGWTGSVVRGVAIRPSDIALIGTTLVLVVAIEAMQRRTRIGQAFRAVAQDRQAAALMGINPAMIVAISFVIAGALAGLGAVLVAPRLGIRFNISLSLGVFGFIAAVIGGLGSTRGAVAGGYLLALVGGVVGVATSDADTWGPLVTFAVFIVVLVFRPTGLFGRPVIEKV